MRPPLLPRELLLLRDPELRELELLRLRDPELREPELREPELRDPELRDPPPRDPPPRDPPPPPPRRCASSMLEVDPVAVSAVDGAIEDPITAKPAVGCRLSTRLMKPAMDVLVLLFIA